MSKDNFVYQKRGLGTAPAFTSLGVAWKHIQPYPVRNRLDPRNSGEDIVYVNSIEELFREHGAAF